MNAPVRTSDHPDEAGSAGAGRPAPDRKLQRRAARRRELFDPELLGIALRRSVLMLDPRTMARNPVMFTVEVGAALTTLVTFQALLGGPGDLAYFAPLTLLLWFTVGFANFAEALAEARGQAQAETLRATREETVARRVTGGREEEVSSELLRAGDVVRVAEGETIPADGEVVEGIASVDESAITGESAPVIREAGGDRSGVTGGTRVLSDEITVRVTAGAGESFLDRMIALVEGASRQKTPNEIALTLVLAGFTLAFLIVTGALPFMASYFHATIDVPTLVALLVCLIPTTIGALLPAIGIAGMDRALSANVLAKSGKAVELAGDVDTLLLDKTGTITLGNRQARRMVAAPGVDEAELARAAALASAADSTPEGRSILELAVELLGGERPRPPAGAEPVAFSAETRVSGVDLPGGGRIRKGAPDAIRRLAKDGGQPVPGEVEEAVTEVAQGGGTPLLVARDARILGVVALEDTLKPGIRDRFARLKGMGLRIVMVTGDNPLTARAIADEAGVDDFLAEATPEQKLAYIRSEQGKGRLVAMMGDGTNDAPALAQADLGVAMNAGTQAAKEASNMVDLDSDPTKLIEVVEIGKQLLMTRGALTTFSFANDVAKYFAIVPAMFYLALPQLQALNVMHLTSPRSAILSAVVFNAIIIPLLIPIALRGVRYRPVGAGALLRRNLLLYGFGGVVVPFVGIKLLDLGLTALGLS
ncbi:MAG: potassium-transporting ATPase subunit KdpB [Candidatus Palauibacterales bacterium]|nr:potassium-transporting ATPase subunit KdpB [Candidatus Palauibacterales bacterium]